MALTLSIPQLAEQWRPISAGDETTKVTALIKRAISMIRIRVAGIDARVDADPDLMEVARGVIVDMIKRAVPNTPDVGGGQVSQHLQVAGSFTDQVLFKTPSANLYILDNELALLFVRPGSGVGTIYTPPAR